MKEMKNIMFGISSFVIGLTVIAFITKEIDNEVCEKVIIDIENQLNNHFIDATDVKSLLTLDGQSSLEGQPFANIRIRSLEQHLVSEDYILKAQIYKEHKGVLMVKIVLHRPIARIVRVDGPDNYITSEGVLLPVSDTYSSRVIVISGATIKQLEDSLSLATADFQQLLVLLNFINDDPFWKAQIAQIDFIDDNEVILLPQVTKQKIEFGSLDHIEQKFMKLMIFYKQILPREGWNNYKLVNLKFENQIICE